MLFSVALLSLFCVISALRFESHYSFSRHNYPHYTEESCGRGYGKKSYVCDPDSILKSQEKEADQLDRLIGETVNDTICPCSTYSCERHPEGYKIGIALTKKMLFDDNTKHEEDELDEGEEIKKRKVMQNLHQAQLYAHDIQKRWKLGNCDEDVIIFFSVEDNVVYTVTGDVARTKLTNELVATIAKEARWAGFHSKNQSPFSGLWKIVNDYRAVFLNSYHPRPPRKGEVSSNFGLSLFSDQAGALLTCVAFMLSILLMK